MADPTRQRTRPATATALLGLLSWLAYVVVPGGSPTAYAPVALGICAAVVGVVALFRTWRRPESFAGQGRIVLGIVLGLLAAACWWSIVHQMLYLPIASVCASNLHCLGQAINTYHQREGAYPSDLQQLVPAGLATQKQLQCPLAWFRDADNAHYVYIAGLSPDIPADWILAYDDPSNHGDDAEVCVLYCSGEVERMALEKFAREFKRFRVEHIEARGEPPATVGPDWP